MTSVLYLLTFAVGAGLTIQVGCNARLAAAFGGPIFATLVNFGIGTTALLLLWLATRHSAATHPGLTSAPAWAWLGGLLGAGYVVAATLAGPRIGALLLLAVSVLGQLAASLIVDHYGLLGFPQHPLTLTRLAGVALLFSGVVLAAR
jgi:bacterial/archaeal transporter family-2 protein